MSVKRTLVTFALASLTACSSAGWKAEPGQYTSFDEAIRIEMLSQMTGPRWSAVPADVKAKMADCLVKTIRGETDSAMMQKLDAAARGEASVSAGEVKATLRRSGFPVQSDQDSNHVWTTAELDAKARKLGWVSLATAAQIYVGQGVAPSLALQMASEDIIKTPLPEDAPVGDIWEHARPYCPNDITLFKLYLAQPTPS